MPRVFTLTLSLAVVFVMVVSRQPATPAAAEATIPASLASQDLSLSQARLVLDAALAAAEEQGARMDIAVVDAGGNL